MASECMIRAAVASDLGRICALIRELAVYEQLEHAVSFDEAEMRTHLFGPAPKAEVLLAEEAGAVVGFALFFPTFSTFLGKPGMWLEDLFVVPASRGRGHGSALIAAVARVAVKRDCGRLEWSVLDWNEPSIAFYRALGAKPLDDWTTFRITGGELKDLAAR